MCAAPIGANADTSRGKRLKKVLEKIGSNTNTPAARSRLIGVEDSKYRRYERGANIPNEILARITELGGDVVYILTGKKAATAQAINLPDSGVVREPSKMLQILKLLADIEIESQLDAESWESWQSCLQSLEHELLDAQKMFALARSKRSRKRSQSAG